MTSLEGALAVTRFGLGAKNGEIDIASRAPKVWLESQLKSPVKDPAYIEAFSGLRSARDAYGLSKTYKNAKKFLNEKDLAVVAKAYGKR